MITSALLILAATIVDPATVVVPGAVFVLVEGQSNGAGRGELLPADSAVAESGVYVLRKDGRAWTAAEPYDWPNPAGGVGTSLGRTLARDLLNSGLGISQVWLVHCAVAGTPITRWTGEAVPAGTSLAVKNAGGVDYTLCLQLAAQLVHLGVRPLAVAWHQGESGCNNAAETALYADRLRRIRDRHRAWFPGILFVGGELAESYGCTYKGMVNAAVAAVSDGLASSAGLTTRDGTHFDRDSLRELGSRYAAEVVRLMGGGQ